MAYFEDLTDYSYYLYRPHTKNVGWLASTHDFPKLTPPEEMLDLLWEHCKISVVQMRGLHHCEFCAPPSPSVYAIRQGQRLQLGSAEVRVLSRGGDIYAAPTLIYHYVKTHHYKPPDEFLRALTEGIRPPSPEYFEALKMLNLEWNKTSGGDSPGKGFRGSVEVRLPIYFDES